ncbi:MAG: hypothetical protein WBE10_17805, partial [Candidatus Acidiferrum sp.]
MTDDGAGPSSESPSKSPIQRFEPVASAVHTFVLLIIMAAVVVAGYFSVHRDGAVHHPNRVLFYLVTMAWEWIV